MLRTFSLLAVAVTATALISGCTNVERKFGRGMRNTFEIVRMGELRRNVEQTSLFQGPDTGFTTGFVRGVDRSLGRTGIGIYEIVTAPFPPYDPVLTDYYAPGPVYPDSHGPGVPEGTTYATDNELGFSGGDILPFIPGNRFRIFDSP